VKQQYKSWFFITVIGFSVFLVAGCGNTSLKDTSPIPQVNTQQSMTTPQPSSGVSTSEADYTKNCATCHEAPPPTNNLQQIIKVVNSGKGRMPSFKGKLSSNQIQAIAEYIVSDR